MRLKRAGSPAHERRVRILGKFIEALVTHGPGSAEADRFFELNRGERSLLALLKSAADVHVALTEGGFRAD